MNLNGMNLNGMNLNGMNLNGMNLNGMNLNGMNLNGMNLNGTQLSATQNSSLLSGSALTGSVMNITMGASHVQVRIDATYIDPLSTTGDVYLYDASYQVQGTGTWTSLCKDASGNPVPGILLSNYWDMMTGARIDDPNAITFACVNGAIGKCVRWGYRPWATGTRCVGSTCTTVSLKDYHQACTRMVRADYCGNGKTNTVNGTPIDVYDGLSPQIQSPETTWPVEARWTPGGATCLGNTRGADLIKKFKYPDCKGPGGTGYNQSNPFPVCADGNYSVTGADLLGNNYQSIN
jgi:hypothetical protein